MIYLKKRLTVIFFLIAIYSYGQEIKDTIVAEHFQTDKFDIAIFPASSKDMLPGNDRFTPTKEEIGKAENALKVQLKTLNSERQNQFDTPIIDKNLNKYKRQYFGYINSNGEKILFINCFWKREKDILNDWLKERINVLDGGSYYWNVRFNLNKNILTDLEVNGGI